MNLFPPRENKNGNDALSDWTRAEKDYLAQRLLDGNIPHQFWNPDKTIERRAYRIYLERAKRS